MRGRQVFRKPGIFSPASIASKFSRALTSSNRLPGPSDAVAVLELTVDGTETDIERAVVAVSRDLPPGATLTVA